ncbi:Multisubstrate pseudouridine synthase 7 [Eumeta japonica]|uniref:Multisubstrate pseudouridine synthase 7 n=1 Tax=Eumeta variegata TaxID=151549 RepID=A0A4C1ZKK9_EUMVA|nr:Multisubstrate pseudouridine synthase 7 [Eumeta japonica]
MNNERDSRSLGQRRGQTNRSRGFRTKGGTNYGQGSWRNGSSKRGLRGSSRASFGGNDRDDRRYDSSRQNNWGSNRQHNYMPVKRLTEEDIGVTEYVSDHNGFNGIIKSRYADFHVSEINLNGEIAKLTNLDPPEEIKNEEIKEDEELLLSKYNLELLPMETWDKINCLAICTDPTSERVEVDVTGMSKEHRTKIHDAVKKAFGEAIVGSTVTVNDKKIVRFEKYRIGVRIDNRIKWMWPGQYLHFILHKENCDTMEAASRIADKLKLSVIKPHIIGYAGTKDRRAKTSQWFSVRKVEPKRLQSACAGLRDIFIGNYNFSNEHIKLGMLKGNRFRIALRNVTTDDAVIDKVCEDLKTKGFINYYGLQRFGTRHNMPTYDIGRKLLQGNFKEAINCILDVRDGPLRYALLKFKETGDAGLANRLLKNCSGIHNTIEARLLKALARDPNDLVGAVGKLSRNTRLLYVHSYQSIIWNRCVSERIKRFGLKLAVGDIVLMEATDAFEEAVETNDVDQESEEEERQEDESKTHENSEHEDSNKDVNVSKFRSESELANALDVTPKLQIKILTQEDMDTGKYSIIDMLLPLPGHNVQYPPNMKDYYEELLSKDNISLDMQHKIKCYRMSGTYRRVFVKPSELEWRCVRYVDPHGDLLLSDLDELKGRELTALVPDGKFKALLLTMSLPASCYATMALRELLRADTSGESQALQNNYYLDAKTEPDTKTEQAEKRKTEEECEDEVDSKKSKQDFMYAY